MVNKVEEEEKIIKTEEEQKEEIPEKKGAVFL